MSVSITTGMLARLKVNYHDGMLDSYYGYTVTMTTCYY